MSTVPAFRRIRERAAQFPASSGRCPWADPRILRPVGREQIRLRTAQAQAWHSARRTNIPATHEAELAEALIRHANTAFARHPNPSSTRRCPCPESEQRSPGSPELRSFRFSLARKSSSLKDNSFPFAGLYLSETTPLSLHFGEPRLPVFFALSSRCGRTLLAEGSVQAARCIALFCDATMARLARSPICFTMRPSVSSPAVSSAREFPCPHVSPPSRTGAESALPCPGCC